MFWFHRPKWYENAVIYQIYPWSFQDSNGDGIGDLEGIISKLDYFRGSPHSLGVDALWISPVYPSPMKDFGYDVTDYCNIDPRFGTLGIFDKLIVEAHKRGLKIIMDLVVNHTSREHPWFQEARMSKTNPKRDWYVWKDPLPGGLPPNNWLAVSGGPAWTPDPSTGQCYLHHFLPHQPDLNWRNEEVRREFKKIIDFWLKRGVDGFRVDAVAHTIEDERFRDDPVNKHFASGVDIPYDAFLHLYDENQPEVAGVINYICECSKKFKDIFVVTESYLNLAKLMKIYDGCPYHNHAPFNFNFFEIFKEPWSAESYRSFINAFDKLVGPNRIPTYVLGNHDHKRILTRFGEHRTRLLALMLLTLRGTAFVYYGEEIGMRDVAIPKHKMKDGFATLIENPSIIRDPERTPMQWSDDLYAGFSEAEPWLPVSDDYAKVNVKTERANPESMFYLYKMLLYYRNASECLRYGAYMPLDTKSADIFFYKRYTKKEEWFVMLNFSNETVVEELVLIKKDINIVCSSYMNAPLVSEKNKITLRPYEGILFTL
ncbi:MAG: alpha-amylase family glycosyl hydrolase [Candidatus Pacebacteria bacterium]|nr:alpha-amylase family glycosyl hydrolase [Candidatus Paceibacterota bacterium]MDD5357024.1 alpha-amylase family glycosyl hydrolase [Candidatus Paceibacterota bacterium]